MLLMKYATDESSSTAAHDSVRCQCMLLSESGSLLTVAPTRVRVRVPECQFDVRGHKARRPMLTWLQRVVCAMHANVKLSIRWKIRCSLPCVMMKAAVIGPGRVGRAIAGMYGNSVLIGRHTQPVDWQQLAPIWVCTTNDALDAVVATIPQQRRRDLILLQNGMLLPWLHSKQLQPTQVLLYMGATAQGQVTDGKLSLAYGPWAEHAAATLQAGGVTCGVTSSWEEFSIKMVAKLLWSCLFWMLSAALGDKPVGDIAKENEADVQLLVEELLPLAMAYLETHRQSGGALHTDAHVGTSAQAGSTARPKLGPSSRPHSTALTSQVCQDLLAYSLQLGDVVPSAEMARQEFAWRNGFFLRQGRTPLHLDWLQRAGCNPEELALMCQPGQTNV